MSRGMPVARLPEHRCFGRMPMFRFFSPDHLRVGRRRRAATVVAVTGLVLAGFSGGAPPSAANNSGAVEVSVAGGGPPDHASRTIYGMAQDGALPHGPFYPALKWH